MEKKHLYACLITLMSAPSGAYQKVVVTDSKPMPEVIIFKKQK